MTVPPNKKNLQALAGWALSAKSLASDQQSLALGHFQDACGELSQVIDCLPVYQTPTVEDRKEVPTYTYSTTDFAPMPIEVQQHLGVQHVPDGECQHRFDIKSQRCLFCGKTYRQAKGRKSELM